MTRPLIFFGGTNLMLQAPDGKAAIRVENIKHGPSAEAGMVMIFLPNHTPIVRVGQTYDLPSGYTYEVTYREEPIGNYPKGNCPNLGYDECGYPDCLCKKIVQVAVINPLQPVESEDDLWISVAEFIIRTNAFRKPTEHPRWQQQLDHLKHHFHITRKP